MVILLLLFRKVKCDKINNLGFLTAMRQEVTRMHKGWSLDSVTIDNMVLRIYKDDIREAPAEVRLLSD